MNLRTRFALALTQAFPIKENVAIAHQSFKKPCSTPFCRAVKKLVSSAISPVELQLAYKSTNSLVPRKLGYTNYQTQVRRMMERCSYV